MKAPTEQMDPAGIYEKGIPMRDFLNSDMFERLEFGGARKKATDLNWHLRDLEESPQTSEKKTERPSWLKLVFSRPRKKATQTDDSSRENAA